MSHKTKLWIPLICLLSYFFLGQAGCQTLTSQEDITYIRSDLAHMRRDLEDVKKKMAAPESAGSQDILRNQAAQREALIELNEGQQRLENKSEETSYQMESLKQEVTNLKLNLLSQMEALSKQVEASRSVNKSAQPAPQPLAPSYSTPGPRGTSPEEPAFAPSLSVPPVPSVPSTPQAPVVISPPQMPQTPQTPETPSVPPPGAAAPQGAAVARSDMIDYTKLYDTAYEDYVRQSYPLARSEFEEYLRRFPETDLADNAQYWVGECFFAEGKYEQAADAFKKVIERYPTGNKVPRAMLKAGYALMQLGREQEGKDMFQQVVDAYPLSSEADQAKIKLRSLP